MILFPNAKINLGLYITRRRDDGYHDLSTCFYPVKWRDIIEIVPAHGDTITLTVTGRKVECEPEKNLVMKAYRALDSVIPLPPVDIYLHKVIPDGAGLGGGSADAAFTLLGLNELLQLKLPKERLAAIASTVGADCSFFIYNTPMLAAGIGDIFTPADIDLSDYCIAIVKPHASVSTREAYSGVTPRLPSMPLDMALAMPVESWRDNVANDFEESIFPSHPEISEVKSMLYDLGAVYASMSGSGASVFGLFPASRGDILADELNRLFTGCDIHCSPLV